MGPGMKILPVACPSFALLLLLACASPVPQAPLSGFGKSLASEADRPALHGRADVHADADGALWLEGADGNAKRTLAPDLRHAGFEPTVAARGAADDGGTLRWEWLATLSRRPQAQLAVLRILDAQGRLAHEEVLLEECAELAWRDGAAPELLLGCSDRVWRYRPGPASEATLTLAGFASSGRAFGPLSLGDSDARVRAALALAGGACPDAGCTSWRIALGGREFKLLPQFQQGTLHRLTVLGPHRPRGEWSTKVRADWRALVSEVAREADAAEVRYPSTTALAAVPGARGVAYAETHHPQRDGVKASIGVFRSESGNARAFGAIAVIAPASGPAPAPASAAE
jgi:hypothetical protein